MKINLEKYVTQYSINTSHKSKLYECFDQILLWQLDNEQNLNTCKLVLLEKVISIHVISEKVFTAKPLSARGVAVEEIFEKKLKGGGGEWRHKGPLKQLYFVKSGSPWVQEHIPLPLGFLAVMDSHLYWPIRLKAEKRKGNTVFTKESSCVTKYVRNIQVNSHCAQGLVTLQIFNLKSDPNFSKSGQQFLFRLCPKDGHTVSIMTLVCLQINCSATII